MRNFRTSLFLLILSWFTVTDAFCQVIANNDDFLVNENEPYTDSFIYNDQFPSGQTAVYSLVEGPQNGSIILQSNGTFTYTPPLNEYWFRDSVYYQVCVGNVCDIAGVEFYVIFRNTQPFAGADNFLVEMNQARTANVSQNDGDPDSITDPISTLLHWVKLNNPTNGIITSFDTTGTFTYVPNTGFMGNDSFQYYVVDHCGLYEVATVYLTIVAPNQSPTAGNQTINSLLEDVVYNGSLNSLANDPENDALSFSLVSPSPNGQVMLSSNGTYSFTPSPNFNGTTSFQYAACDIVGQCANGTITLVVSNVDNDPPVLVVDAKILNEDSSATINVALNDTDDTGTLTYSLFTNPAHGSASLVSATGTFSYTPNPNYFGFDNFVIQACDGVNCSTSIVYIQVNGINDPPVAQPYTLITSEDVPSSGTIAFISDPDLTPLSFSTPQGNTVGGLIINTDGTYSYTPAANYFGTQSVFVQGCDAQNNCTGATLTLQVNAVNDLPSVTNKNFTFIEDAVLESNVSSGNSDVEGSVLTYSTTSQAAGGTLNLNANGSFVYTPIANWFGTETFSIQCCDNQNGCSTLLLNITVTGVNDLPVLSGSSFSTNEDVALSGNLNTVATDIETASLAFTITTNVVNGTFNVSSNGSFIYTPQANYFGVETVAFTACDAANDCVSGTMNITVNSINDAPIAQDRSITINEDASSSGVLAITDVDHANLNVSIVNGAQNGQFSINNQGQYTYTPNANYFGSETLTISVCDPLNACDGSTITIQIISIPDAPQANDDAVIVVESTFAEGSVALNDTDGDGDALLFTALNEPSQGSWSMLSDGAFTYTPAVGFLGNEIVEYRVCDSTNRCDTATLVVNVVTANTAPSAQNSASSTTEDLPITVSLSEFITDAEGGSFTFSTLAEPQFGTVQWLPGNTFTYTPQLNYFGADVFTYRACDSGNLCAEAMVTIEITSVNDAPLLIADVLLANEDNSVSSSIASNDLEAEGEPIIYTLTGSAVNGDITLSSVGLLNYIPVANFSGTETVTYTACDSNNNCANGILEITILAVNDLPQASDAAYTTDEDIPVNGNLQFYVQDAENDALTYAVTSSQMVITNDGAFTFTPEENFFGEVVINYSVCDAPMSCTSASVTFAVNSLNDAPVAQDDFISISEDESAEIPLQINDNDAENDGLLYSFNSTSSLGEITLNPNGDLTLVPYPNVFGSDTISVNICDVHGECTTASLFIDIAASNDAPIIQPILIETLEEMTSEGSILGYITEIEGQATTFSIAAVSALGNFELNTDGTYVFTPTADAFGSDAIAFEVCDSEGLCSQGLINLSVLPVNDAPQSTPTQLTLSEDAATDGNFNDYSADADNDTLQFVISQDVSHGSMVIDATGHFVYAPEANFFGMDTLIYNACDHTGACSEGMMVFEVTFLNDLPIVVNEGLQLIINESVSGSVAANDIELDFETLVYTIVGDESGGEFILNSDGTFTYTPAADTSGLFYVEYSACDPCNACSQGIIQLYVVSAQDANTPPTAESYNGSVCQGSSLTINVFNLVSDNQDASESLQLAFGTANNGSYQLDPETQELIFQAGAFSSGQVIIPYYVCDNGIISMCDTGFIAIDILPSSGISITDLQAASVSCFGSADGFIALQAEGVGQLTYAWSNGLTEATIENLSGGIYSVVISSDQACVATQSAEFTIAEPQQLVATSEINDLTGDGIGAGDDIALSISGGFGNYTIDWQTSFGSTGQGTDFSITQDGSYSYTITDANGCTVEGSVAITAVDNRALDALLSFYPNPVDARQSITFQCTGSMEWITIHDSHGRLIYNAKPMNNKFTVDASGWASGVYHCAVSTGGRIINGTIVKP